MWSEVRSEERVGERDPQSSGVVPFTVDGIDHGLVAAILGYEHGIGVRNGCFCAHPYLAYLLGLDRLAVRRWATRVHDGDKRDAPGMVRMSLGFYNEVEDVDRLVDALRRIAAGDVAGRYACDDQGEYRPTAAHALAVRGTPRG